MSQTNARFQGGGVILPQGSSPGGVNVGEKALIVDTDGLVKTQDSTGTLAPVGGRTGLISAGSSATTLATAIAQANAQGALTVEMGKGTYNITAKSIINANGIALIGNGPGSTFLQLDDAGGLAGDDAILLNSVLYFALRGMTVISTAARTAGSVVKVLGKNNITATPAQRTRLYTIEDVDMEDQFNGVVFNDGPASAGAWGGFINRGEWVRFNTGGVAIWVNSPSGGQHYITNMKLYNGNATIDANRALAAVRYQGGADLEMTNVNTVYFKNGLLIDPPNGQAANVTIANDCLWDNNTQASVKVAPAGGGTVLGVELNGGWGFTPSATSQPCVQIDGGQSIELNGGKYWGNFQGVRISGPAKHVSVCNADFSGSGAGMYATSNASDFSFTNNRCGIFSGVTPTVGIQVDAGCNHYSIIGNNVREATTPITNTPGTSAGVREVANNITA